MKKIKIFDTTLRDGEQAPSFHLFLDEKIVLARQLAKLGVDIIEAGFANSMPGEYKAIDTVARELRSENITICSLARALDKDIEMAAKSLEHARNPRIHTFIATSDIHIEHKLKKTRSIVLETAVEAVKKAKSYVEDVEFSCEDWGRTDLDYGVDVISECIRAGAKTINLPDTVGYLMPYEMYERVKYTIEKIRERKQNATFSVHCHDDLGLATANALSGIMAGAEQVEVTLHGTGERAGNCSLEEIIAILNNRNIGMTGIRRELIGETSRVYSEITGIKPNPNKAIVGENAFAHEAGIHQDGVVKAAQTYEIMVPEDFGYKRRMVLGPRSGKTGLREKYREMGIEFSDFEFERIYQRFIQKSDGVKEFTDDMLIELAVVKGY